MAANTDSEQVTRAAFVNGNNLFSPCLGNIVLLFPDEESLNWWGYLCHRYEISTDICDKARIWDEISITNPNNWIEIDSVKLYSHLPFDIEEIKELVKNNGALYSFVYDDGINGGKRSELLMPDPSITDNSNKRIPILARDLIFVLELNLAILDQWATAAEFRQSCDFAKIADAVKAIYLKEEEPNSICGRLDVRMPIVKMEIEHNRNLSDTDQKLCVSLIYLLQGIKIFVRSNDYKKWLNIERPIATNNSDLAVLDYENPPESFLEVVRAQFNQSLTVPSDNDSSEKFVQLSLSSSPEPSEIVEEYRENEPKRAKSVPVTFNGGHHRFLEPTYLEFPDMPYDKGNETNVVTPSAGNGSNAEEGFSTDVSSDSEKNSSPSEGSRNGARKRLRNRDVSAERSDSTSSFFSELKQENSLSPSVAYSLDGVTDVMRTPSSFENLLLQKMSSPSALQITKMTNDIKDDPSELPIREESSESFSDTD